MARSLVGRWRAFATPVALALISLLAAVALWVAVTESENPSRAQVFRGAIEVRAVNVPEGLAVAGIREPNVTLRISAPENTLAKLTTADFRAEVDLSGVRQSTADLRVLARVVGRRDVEIIEVSPAIVSVALEPVATRTVPVLANLVGSPPQGFSVGETELNPSQVRITGAESLVRLVSAVAADVNLTGLRVAIRQQYPLVPRDARGADIRGVRVEPGSGEVKVGIVQQEVTLTLTVLPQVQGTVADGYNLVSVISDPPTIGVSGALELLQALPVISTESVDVNGLRADATRTVRIRLPAGLQAGRDSVSVRLKVVPALGEITIAVPPQVVGAEGLRVTSLQASSVTLRLSGELPALRALQPGSVRANLVVSGLGEGIHVVRVTPVTPSDAIQVVAVEPSQVVVGLAK